MLRPAKTQTDHARKLLLLFTATLICGLTVACSTFPDDAKRALDETARESEGANFAYTVVSAQKATNLQYSFYQSYQEVWCIVTDKGFGYGKPRHWTTGRMGLLWKAESFPELLGKESFLALGCSNW
jgi:hypothetical protein